MPVPLRKAHRKHRRFVIPPKSNTQLPWEPSPRDPLGFVLVIPFYIKPSDTGLKTDTLGEETEVSGSAFVGASE